MSFDLSDWTQYQKSRHERVVPIEGAQAARHLQQAAIAMSVVTHSPEWNAFLQLLQAEIETRRAAVAEMQERFLADFAMSADTLASQKMQAMVLHAEAVLLEQVIRWPAQIMSDAEPA